MPVAISSRTRGFHHHMRWSHLRVPLQDPQQRKTAAKQRGCPLFFDSPNRRRPRISAGKDAPAADNFLQKQQRQREVLRLVGVLLFSCLLLSAGAAAGGQAPDSMFLEELSWTELRDLGGSGKTTIIVPIGGTEQNGPHMALGKHNRRVQVLSEKIARALGNALVAPVIAY